MFDAKMDAEGFFGLPTDHESLAAVSDRASGLEAIVAIHSTARGPAFGGCRYWHYENRDAAIRDARRLAEGMSLKNALADLPFGGGKAVIIRNPRQTDRQALFSRFGRFVESLEGRYVTAEDVGTTEADMAAIAAQTPYVSGLKTAKTYGGNPSPKTALGVFVAIRSGVRQVLNRRDLDGLVVAVQGLGSVGWDLCRLLAGAGCKLIVADINPAVAAKAVEQFGANTCEPDAILFQDADVLAPCALGGVLNVDSIPKIRAKLIAGAANNQLQSITDGDSLHKAGIYYLPDFLVNAGGIVSAVREYQGKLGEQQVIEEVERIGQRVEELVARVARLDLAPARAADAWARSLLVPTR
ncbi:Glu/Leu/Phe/Val family dehydrogenase [Solimonas terrae]|nr:Glu/Leu/Phe/Val dehydrogenase dimerization domain-containing protein [Solimonas terrae]